MLYHQEHGACGTYMQEHDACGIGSIVNIDGRKDHKVLDDALHIVEKLEHRAGKDATGEVGDGVGILTQISHKFFAKYFAEEAAKEAALEAAKEASKETLKAGITQLTHSEEGGRRRLRYRHVLPAAEYAAQDPCEADVRGDHTEGGHGSPWMARSACA